MSMKTAAFMISPTSPAVAKLPRRVRVMIREQMFHPAKPKSLLQPKTNEDLDQVITGWDGIDDPYDDAHALACNTLDQDFDLDGSQEFADSTEEDNLHGLTIVEPGFGNIRRWLRGRDIL